MLFIPCNPGFKTQAAVAVADRDYKVNNNNGFERLGHQLFDIKITMSVFIRDKTRSIRYIEMNFKTGYAISS